MAKVNLTAEIKQKWWVKPLVYTAAFAFTLAGKDEFPEAFSDFIVQYGFKIEITK